MTNQLQNLYIPQNSYITPEQAYEILNRSLYGMMHDDRFDARTIKMFCDHLRATLAPLIRVKTEDAT